MINEREIKAMNEWQRATELADDVNRELRAVCVFDIVARAEHADATDEPHSVVADSINARVVLDNFNDEYRVERLDNSDPLAIIKYDADDGVNIPQLVADLFRRNVA